MGTNANGTTAWRSGTLAAALLTGVLAALVPAAPVGATEPPGPPPLAGVGFTDAWTNDDGSVDGADTADIGDVNGLFDAHGPDSSDDPSAEGLDPPRYDKDVARCSAGVRDGDAGFVDVLVDPAYPGYVCTFVVTFENGTGVPATVAPAAIVYDAGLTVTELTAPPGIVGPGETASGAYAVRIEQRAPQGATLAFSIVLGFTGDDPAECVPLTEIPDGAVPINASGLCTYFFDGNPGDCGPEWNEDNPYAWHFVANKTRNLGEGRLTAVFLSGLTIEEGPSQVNRNNQQFYLYTPTADTLVGAYVQFPTGDPSRAKLVLSHTCNEPIGGGHTGGADLGLSMIRTGTDDDLTAVTITLANDGFATATDVVVAAQFPAAFEVVAVAVPRGTDVAADGAWHIPALGAGESLELTITGRLGDGVHVVSAEVTGSGVADVDSRPGNGASAEDDYAALALSRSPTVPLPDGGAAAALVASLMLAVAVYLLRRRPTAALR